MHLYISHIYTERERQTDMETDRASVRHMGLLRDTGTNTERLKEIKKTHKKSAFVCLCERKREREREREREN